MKFNVEKKSDFGRARLGKIDTEHGSISTPVFMPVGTRATVKTVTQQHLKDMHAEIILGNTYHLMLKPGMDIIAKAGGLHKFMNWDLPILTDSGGFQVFSLAKLNKITNKGVRFRSHIDGSYHFLGPQESMQIQKVLGSDIVMVFDECSPYPCSQREAEFAVKKTLRWAKECRNFELQKHQNLFGIVQGSVDPELRKHCALELAKLDFEGFAIGGVSVGEPAHIMNDIIDYTEPYLPEDKPRYLMGVGTPRNIIEAVKRGIDMFDCVMPTRNARNGTAFTWQGKINIKNACYAEDFSPLDSSLDCYTSQFSKAYIRHLFNVGEVLGLTLISIQNLSFYIDFMAKMRESIRINKFEDFYLKICEIYPK